MNILRPQSRVSIIPNYISMPPPQISSANESKQKRLNSQPFIYIFSLIIFWIHCSFWRVKNPKDSTHNHYFSFSFSIIFFIIVMLLLKYSIHLYAKTPHCTDHKQLELLALWLFFRVFNFWFCSIFWISLTYKEQVDREHVFVKNRCPPNFCLRSNPQHIVEV